MFQYSFSRHNIKKAHSAITSLFALNISWAQLGSNQRPPDYELQIGISMGLHRFVSVYTSLFCNRIIVKDFMDLHHFRQILAPKLAPFLTYFLGHMSNMVGFIRLNLFVKIDLFEWLNHPFLQDKAPPGQIQLDLF